MELKPREELLTSIAEDIKDYREGELPTPTAEHVDRWISQFAPEVQLPLLNSFERNCTYLSKDFFKSFFRDGYLKNEKIVGNDPKGFWKAANFLSIQRGGRSQREILRLVDEGLKECFGIDLSECAGGSDEYIYFDDGLFSGSRVKQDLEPWIRESAPKKFKLNLFMMVVHSLGEFFTLRTVRELAKECGKEVEIHIWRAVNIENRLSERNHSEVLWPIALPESELMKPYLEQLKRPFEPRQVDPHSTRERLKDEEERQLLEREFLLAGLRIRSFSQNPNAIMRPLGFSPFGMGFGSMIVTYRNCPNNCPLALWWGDPRQHPTGPLSRWYALFPRRPYAA